MLCSLSGITASLVMVMVMNRQKEIVMMMMMTMMMMTRLWMTTTMATSGVSLNLGIVCVAIVLSASFPAERLAIVAATRSRCRSMQRPPARSTKAVPFRVYAPVRGFKG